MGHVGAGKPLSQLTPGALGATIVSEALPCDAVLCAANLVSRFWRSIALVVFSFMPTGATETQVFPSGWESSGVLDALRSLCYPILEVAVRQVVGGLDPRGLLQLAALDQRSFLPLSAVFDGRAIKRIWRMGEASFFFCLQLLRTADRRLDRRCGHQSSVG